MGVFVGSARSASRIAARYAPPIAGSIRQNLRNRVDRDLRAIVWQWFDHGYAFSLRHLRESATVGISIARGMFLQLGQRFATKQSKLN